MAGHNFWLVGDIAKDPEALASQYFIARVTSHIPDKGQVMIRYYGLYSKCPQRKDAKRPPLPNSQTRILIAAEDF
ncbi:MAG: transposase [Candidatus Aminicenantes bacterium]|nr:transposase [Candidatus Aminicenantes bacterium]